MQTGNALPQNNTSKKERIIAWMKGGKVSDDQIAQTENTSIQYVRKVRCNLKKLDGVDEKNRNTQMSSDLESSPTIGRLGKVRSQPDMRAVPPFGKSTLAGLSATSERIPIGHQRSERPRLSGDQRKALWSDFKRGKTPIDCVIKYGYSPSIIRSEYQAYMEFDNIHYAQSQALVVEWLESHKPALEGVRPGDYMKFAKIISDYKNKRYLTKEQHVDLFRMCLALVYELGKESVVNQTDHTPKGLVRPLCMSCHEPMEGLVGRIDSPLAFKALESVKYWKHSECM